jgi:hypothetical protein
MIKVNQFPSVRCYFTTSYFTLRMQQVDINILRKLPKIRKLLLYCTVGWVDIGTVARVPLRFVVYLKKKYGKWQKIRFSK